MFNKAGIFWAILIVAFITNGSFAGSGNPGKTNTSRDSAGLALPMIAPWITVYHGLRLDSLGLSSTAFEQALAGWNHLKEKGQLRNQSILTIADFSQPSTAKRLYIIDVEKNELLFHTYVAHGRNSGLEQAVSYSNKAKSHKSSPGFYRTEATYMGSNGYSLKLSGLEKGINDNAYRRAIVVHGADYVSEQLIRNQGYLGRSYGCPAVPKELARPIIDAIKDGSCLYIYTPAPQYAQLSRFVSRGS
ncbi:MAG TPA: murein L,D-transpeptidase catalytic domain family protein [Flavihumibacter sp.]|jgi:hypothetical protein